MRLIRLHEPAAVANGRVELPNDRAHYLVRVLRLHDGQHIQVFDGVGHEFVARVEIEGKRVSLAIGEQVAAIAEPVLQIRLAQAIVRGDKMDWVIQKAVELGVSEIWPMETQRCTVKLNAKRAERRLAHWRQVAISAAEQSGRATVPPVANVRALADLPVDKDCLVLHPHAAQMAIKALPTRKQMTLLVGPEGGFDDAELVRLIAAGTRTVQLGPRVLRTETAGAAALAAIQALHGDWN